MTTAQEFYNNLRKEISFLEDERKIENCTIQLLDSQKEMLYKFFLSLSKRTDIDEKMMKNLIVDVLHKPNIENGKVYEALAKHCYNTLFTYNGAKIDDFMHDNY